MTQNYELEDIGELMPVADGSVFYQTFLVLCPLRSGSLFLHPYSVASYCRWAVAIDLNVRRDARHVDDA